MTTREIYFKIYTSIDLPGAAIGYASKDKNEVIQIGSTLPVRFSDGHEVNIKKMTKKEQEEGFMFWWHSPEGEAFIKENTKTIGHLFASIILNQK